jgi:mycothiol synthase
VDLSTSPPDGWRAREPTLADAGALAELINAVTVAEIGVPYTTADEMRDALTSPDRDGRFPETVVLDADASVVGYTQAMVASDAEVHVFVFTDPRLWGRGLSTWQIRRAETVVADRWPAPVPLRLSRFGGVDAAAELFERRGYERVRTFWTMDIDLTAPPSALARVQGVRIRTFERGRDERATHAALAEAFEDHWGSDFPSFERWLHHEVDGEGSRFDPTLWFVAVEGDDVVGAATSTASTAHAEGSAEVGALGVRRAWRRRGVALALLLTAFGEFHRRGIARAELGVDAASPTGATRLYERAGMRVIRSWEVWEKMVGAPVG